MSKHSTQYRDTSWASRSVIVFNKYKPISWESSQIFPETGALVFH